MFCPEEPFDPQFTLNNATANIIWSVLFGHRFDYNDERFHRILRADNEAVVLAGSEQAQVLALAHDSGKKGCVCLELM